MRALAAMHRVSCDCVKMRPGTGERGEYMGGCSKRAMASRCAEDYTWERACSPGSFPSERARAMSHLYDNVQLWEHVSTVAFVENYAVDVGLGEDMSKPFETFQRQKNLRPEDIFFKLNCAQPVGEYGRRGQSSAPDWAAAEPAVPLAVPPLAGAAPGPFAQSPCAVGGWQTGPGSTSSASQSQSASASRRNRRRGKACVKPQEPPDPGCITTVMVRNLPEDLPQQDFMSELASTFGGTYNFAYLPRDFSSNECKGYAFVNFVDPADASRFRTAWHEDAF
ncbi:unnamed protein product [Prorocentrum cordatum]|uniref:RRM domain-containing protein n=1 Tax=Prorocentrum cordatum TaxID=2364126 RepID=A0ABN9QXC1_9DINO|nr:unnamed protein product [Polarella glacialis]